MKKWLKNMAVILLVVAMIGGIFSACQQDIRDDKDSVTYERYSKEVKFTTARVAGASNMPDGMTLQDNPYTEHMKSDLNVSYEVLWEDSTYGDYLSKLLLSMASNTLPDVFIVNEYSTYQKLYQNDALQDLTDVYNQYANNKMKENYAQYPSSIWDYVTEDGRLMALPSTSVGYQQAMLYVRKDWLDLLNLEPPKTISEIENVARQFVEKDPGGNGKGNTIGINFNGAGCFDRYRNSMGLETVASAMGVYPRQWMQRDDSTVYYGSVQPEFKEVLKLVKRWLDIGILSMDSFTQSRLSLWDNIISGKAGMWFFPWSWGYENGAQFYEKNPRAELLIYNAPLNEKGEANFYTGCPFESMLCVRKGYEHPEVIFKVYQLYDDMVTGRHTEAYEKLQPVRDANTAWYYIAPLGAYTCHPYDEIPLKSKQCRDYVDNGIVPNLFSNSTKKTYDSIKAFINQEDTSPTAWVNYITYYIAQGAEDSPECKPVQPVYTIDPPTAYMDDWEEMLNFEYNIVNQILMGDKPIEVFDAFVADWKSMGGDEITEAVSKWVKDHSLK